MPPYRVGPSVLSDCNSMRNRFPLMRRLRCLALASVIAGGFVAPLAAQSSQSQRARAASEEITIVRYWGHLFELNNQYLRARSHTAGDVVTPDLLVVLPQWRPPTTAERESLRQETGREVRPSGLMEIRIEQAVIGSRRIDQSAALRTLFGVPSPWREPSPETFGLWSTPDGEVSAYAARVGDRATTWIWCLGSLYTANTGCNHRFYWRDFIVALRYPKSSLPEWAALERATDAFLTGHLKETPSAEERERLRALIAPTPEERKKKATILMGGHSLSIQRDYLTSIDNEGRDARRVELNVVFVDGAVRPSTVSEQYKDTDSRILFFPLRSRTSFPELLQWPQSGVEFSRFVRQPGSGTLERFSFSADNKQYWFDKEGDEIVALGECHAPRAHSTLPLPPLPECLVRFRHRGGPFLINVSTRETAFPLSPSFGSAVIGLIDSFLAEGR